MKAIIWGYKYDNMKAGWHQQMRWLVSALQTHGVEVCVHPKLQCLGLEAVPKWNPAKDVIDICVYNHADVSHLIGDILPVKLNLFFKPTVPDEWHTTIDELGFGPYSTITYKKPDFENIPEEEVAHFFNTEVAGWVKDRKTKWGQFFKSTDEVIPYSDYYLVLGQCDGDEVVTRHDFGSYVKKLEQVVRELSRVDPVRNIVVKLHPYMDGEFAKDNVFSNSIKQILSNISTNVHVYTGKSNVHSFIKNARCILLANSGAGFEAMMQHKPIIAWGYPEFHWTSYDLRHLASLMQAIKLDWFDAKKQDQYLYWYMTKYCFSNQETANTRVKELLQKIPS